MESPDILRAVLSFLFIIGLIIAFAVIARKTNGFAFSGLNKTKRRLSIVEVLPIDSKRRLIITKKDDKEFLILIGGNSDVLLEQKGAVANE